MRLMSQSVLALVIGGLSAPYLLHLWPHIDKYGVVFRPVHAAGIRGQTFLNVVALGDVLVYVVLLTPAALAVYALGRRHIWQNVALVAVANVIASTYLVGWVPLQLSFPSILAFATPALALAAGVWLILQVRGRTPNNSSKPTPLRGAA